MQTDDLIRSLAGDLAPVSRRMAQQRIALGLGAGAILTLAAIGLRLGFRPDLGVAMLGFSFWMKWLYTASLAVAAVMATVQLARPETSRLSGLWILCMPLMVLTVLAGIELLLTPATSWRNLLEGRSEAQCTLLVFVLSLPIFAGLVWAFRRLAPGNLRLTGAMAGLASGACAATLYSLHCPEAAATFVLVWYTLGMALAMAGGALLAPRLLRW